MSDGFKGANAPTGGHAEKNPQRTGKTEWTGRLPYLIRGCLNGVRSAGGLLALDVKDATGSARVGAKGVRTGASAR